MQTIPLDLHRFDLLFVGSPTQGGRPTPQLLNFLIKIPTGSLRHTYVCGFDTRLAKEKQGIGFRLFMHIVNFAAPRISTHLQCCGGIAVVDPEGFIVSGYNGPLKSGELVRAALWAQKVKQSVIGLSMKTLSVIS